ncbi:HNH endonuclease [bacterium 1XD21-13]|nr:HNH endonuclease [bacterium 1XD21-13]
MDLILYENNLDVESFVHTLDDATECYKFYWMDSVLTLLAQGKTEMDFNEVINGMIADAWYSVSEYHLHLGLKDRNGNIMNSLERAVNKLIKNSTLKSTATREEIINTIKEFDALLHDEKYQMAKNVPYRLLSSFLKGVGGNDKLWEHKKRLISYIEYIDEKQCILYKVEGAVGLKKKVIINKQWVKMLCDNMVTIKGWIQLKKIRYLQQRNPGVPGIIYKLEPENEKVRKLKNVRELWNEVIEKRPIADIYSGEKLQRNCFEVDHFVPWSYIANDEMWNLSPVNGTLNSSKSNKLPDWDRYFREFAQNQYLLYHTVFEYEDLRKKFENCRRDNLVSIWANEELYIQGNCEEKFVTILEQHMKPIYDSARIQGYLVWSVK